MKFSVRDYERIQNLQQVGTIPIRKSEPLVVDNKEISKRAFEVTRLGLKMFQQGHLSASNGPFGSSVVERFKSRVREFAAGVNDTALFMKAVEVNLFLDTENPFYRSRIVELVQDALA